MCRPSKTQDCRVRCVVRLRLRIVESDVPVRAETGRVSPPLKVSEVLPCSIRSRTRPTPSPVRFFVGFRADLE